MGYRNYIYVVEKEVADSFRGKTFEELKDPTCEDFHHICIYDLFEKYGVVCAIELGKYVDPEPVEPYLSPFFLDKEVHEYTNDEDECMLLDPKGLQSLATYYKNALLKYNKELIEEYDKDPVKAGARMLHDLRYETSMLEFLDKPEEKKWTLCDMWLWKYDILNFMYLLKVVDFDKYYLIWRGY